jgi:hypothetical protein
VCAPGILKPASLYDDLMLKAPAMRGNAFSEDQACMERLAATRGRLARCGIRQTNRQAAIVLALSGRRAREGH